MNAVTYKEKALLSVKIAPSSRGCQKTVTCKIDSEAETNIVPRSLYNQIFPETTVLEKPTVRLSPMEGQIPNLGSCKMYVQGPHKCEPKQITFEVVDVPGPVIIGNTSARELNLSKLNWPVAAIPKSSSGKKTSIPIDEGVFTQRVQRCVYRDGLFPGQPYHIEVDESIHPVQHPLRQVPVHLQPSYKRELERLTDLGIITEVQNEFTPWVNSVVVTPKEDGSIRLCLDPRDVSKAVKRNAYYTRTVDDVIPQVSGLTHFSILDARSGYWQVTLDKESSRLCTFSTPSGTFRRN